MKKLLIVVLFLVVLNSLFILTDDNKKEPVLEDEIRGMYISYIEYMNHFDNKNEEDIVNEINTMVNNLKKDNFNLIILHVRPFSDSIYPSNIYPMSYTVTGKEGNGKSIDVLKYFLDSAHANNIKVHAWINPYRIRNTTDVSSISVENPAFKWIGTNNVKIIEGKGIYYNPASDEVTKLILSGIKELLEKYDIDGISFDDYFYPDKEIDLDNYNSYINNGGNLTIDEYRYKTINDFIKEVYMTIKNYNSDIIFGIAPDANIDNNYETNYADVLTWLKEDGYLDYIMPQIYYGFSNERKPFIKVVNEWNDYIENDAGLIPVLAFYKVGNIDNYALSGKEEWLNSKNIIRNQVLVSRNMDKYRGFVIFRYDSFYSSSEQVLKEKEELINIME